LHERIRRHSQDAAQRIKQEGRANDLLDRLSADSGFEKVDVAAIADPKQFVGRAPEQVDEFLVEIVEPVRQRYASAVPIAADVKV